MNFAPVEKIANAVLYEGFLLYPYRKSAVKNQQRWHFGTLGPAGGSYPVEMQTECLVESSKGSATVDIKIRFLQDEIERDVTLRAIPIGTASRIETLSFPPISASVALESTEVSPGLFRLTIHIRNLSELSNNAACMSSTHTLLAVHDGAFVSIIDPPEAYRTAAAACKNIGTWPVLAGAEGEHALMLSSPIILYDYPQIAPESHGDFFDGTEMDEMLSLRVLTLSDAEKQEVRAGGDRGRQILERTEALPPGEMAKLHGAIRGIRNLNKTAYREGDRVRLHPRKRSDIFDIALDGKIAIIESVECDFEDRIHLAVTVEDDPGRDLGMAKQIGHRFFFSPEDVELV